jgi:hypothetical protein
MNLLKRLASALAGPAPGGGRDLYRLRVRCRRCGEVVEGCVDLRNDLSLDDEAAGPSRYHCRKVLIGRRQCFQAIEVNLVFDAGRRLVGRDISGGEFLGAGGAPDS